MRRRRVGTAGPIQLVPVRVRGHDRAVIPANADIDLELLGDDPARSLGERLRRDMEDANELSIAVAFAKRSALRRVGLADWCADRRSLRLVAGTDFALTELELLSQIGEHPNAKCRVFHLAQEQRSFHPKLYVVEKPRSRVAYVGSANLTAGGLGDNYESVVRLEGPREHPKMHEVAEMFAGFFDSEFSTPVTSEFSARYRELQRAHEEARAERYRLREAQRFAAEDRLSLAVYRQAVARQRWILVVLPDHYPICMRERLWGRQKRNEIERYQPGDLFFFHVGGGRGCAALGMFTGEPFQDTRPLWPASPRGVFPWRIRFVCLGELRHGIPTREILAPLRPGAPKNWFHGFIQSSHSLATRDFDALIQSFASTLRAELTEQP